VTDGNISVLVDCGSGTGQRFVQAGGDLATLDAILLTHAHLDHIGDLASLLFAFNAPELARTKPLALIRSAALAPFIDGLRATFGRWIQPPLTVEDVEVEPGDRLELDTLSIHCFAVDHTESSIGYRLEGVAGETLCIPSDTALCQSVIDAAAGVDCLLIECAATDDKPRKGHLSPSDVLAILDSAAPKMAVVTHLYPATEAAGVLEQIHAKASCPVLGAEDGLSIPVDLAASIAFGLLMDAHGPDRRTGETTRREAGDGQPKRRRAREWTAAELRGLRPSKSQRRLAKHAAEEGTPELNLRGSTVAQALSQLRAAIQTWSIRQERLGLLITGKGKQSKGDPVVKIAVVNWLSGAEGLHWVREWAPLISRGGDFGTIVVRLR
jgi:ribonuclease BN (tRNA processing enzyme)/DNA-nicking Smr family endonuclease